MSSSKLASLPMLDSGIELADGSSPCPREDFVRPQLDWQRQVLQQGVGEWFIREVRHWNTRDTTRKIGQEHLDREADEILDFLVRLCDVLRIQWPHSRSLSMGMSGDLAHHAASLRQAGRLDDADRKVAFLMALAQRLVRRFPGHQSSYVALSEAFAEQAKNAWKREDMETIQRALALSIESLQRTASHLDPGDHEIHRKLEDHKKRLEALPRS